MIQYNITKPKVYVETTVVSYLVARPSHDTTLASRQQATRQLWEEHFDNFDFIILFTIKAYFSTNHFFLIPFGLDH